jgi:hypothetical protein
MSFERQRGRAGGLHLPRPQDREPTAMQRAESARHVATRLEQSRQQLETHLDEIAASKSIGDWQLARRHLDVAMSNLKGSLQGAARYAAHADAGTTARFRAAESACADLVARAESHRTPPVFAEPALACEPALLATLPPDESVTNDSIKHFYDAAEASVGEVLATISARETPVVSRRLQDPGDPLGRRFARFSAERKGKLLAILHSGKRLLAVTAELVTESDAQQMAGRPCSPIEEALDEAPREAREAYAIVRVARLPGEESDPCDRVAVDRIVWSLEGARREVERLQRQAEDGSRYFWRPTRVDPQA